MCLPTLLILVVIYLVWVGNSSAVIDHVIHAVVIVISVQVTVISQSIAVSVNL